MNFSPVVRSSSQKWMLVYHTAKHSQEVEPISDQFFESKVEALEWLIKNKQWNEFIQPEAVSITVTMKLQGGF